MADVAATGAQRGVSSSLMRAFTCKDCQREVHSLQREISELEASGSPDSRTLETLRARLSARAVRATYNENWARGLVERGGSRSDRCKDHRLTHRTHIQGLPVAYIDLDTVGEVEDRNNPGGPLGGLGPLPEVHETVPDTSYDLQKIKVGMTDDDIVEIIRRLRDKQVLILKAGTGTGKSTFAPYRLMDPPPNSLANIPPNAPFAKLTELGQIVVTEPRVQATIGVASFVGGVLSGVGKEVDNAGETAIVGGVGPGYPVGYQVSGDRNHDEACELVYVTDGTMINWLREGRLSRIGTVIVDEAHERSTNIDFIMGYLKRELPRYPHLRVIVTSATFNTTFYQEYFGGPEVAEIYEVEEVKTFGYGMPLFPELDEVADDEPEVAEKWEDPSQLSFSKRRSEVSLDLFVRKHWCEEGPAFDESDVRDKSEVGGQEDVWATTRKLIDLRFSGKLPLAQWREGLSAEDKERLLSEFVKFMVHLAKGLDREGIFGDVLGFLPTTKTIEPACEEIERALGPAYRGNVFPLISTLPPDQQRNALAKRRKGDPRKIVISTNLAETSLTVEGVRFVVDTGVIAQSEWDPELAKAAIPTKAHSQAGIKQRWGRVGRKGPGWVFPLYTKGQYLALAEDTPPGSTRENLESLVMTAKMGGIDDVVNFPWPAAFHPTTTELDEAAVKARETFRRELLRADAALRAGGAVDNDGHPTSFGKELTRFQGLGSTSSALAILYADRLACVPEVSMILALLEGSRLIEKRGLLQDDYEWPDEWRLEAAERHRALAAMCGDDAELVLLIAAAWERADPSLAPWEASERRQKWCRRWFVNNDLLVAAAAKRQEVLGALSPAMKEEVKRFLEPALIDRARAAITRACAAHTYHRVDEGVWHSALDRSVPDGDSNGEASSGSVAAEADRVTARVEDDQLTAVSARATIALRRREARNDVRISNLVLVHDWALPDAQLNTRPTGAEDAMRLVALAAIEAQPDASRNVPLHLLKSWPIGQRVRVEWDGEQVRLDPDAEPIPPFMRPKSDEELGRPAGRRRRWARRQFAESDEPDATRADSDGDINPVGRRQGRKDEDALESRAFEESDKRQGFDSACGRCFACLDGREHACDDPIEVVEGQVIDPLKKWVEEAKRDVDVSHPRLVLQDDESPSAGWYEVVGYDLSDAAAPGLTIRRDWRSEGFRGNPAQHSNVEPGQAVEVVVGPVTAHHQARLRIFLRTDGGGRFLLREASSSKPDIQEKRHEIAVSLDRRVRGLLEDLVEGETLTATVVPTRVAGCYTITLLELLHQHLKKASPGRGVEFQVLDSRRNTKRKPLYNAVVSEPSNEFGYATATLLHQDLNRGIRHRFSFSAMDRRPETEDASPENPQPLQEAQPLLLHVGCAYPLLQVDGLPLQELKDIVASSARRLELLEGEPVAYEPGEPGSIQLSGPNALLRCKTDQPLSRHAAIGLGKLDDSPSWQNEVWTFWARSHHLRVDPKVPCVLGASAEAFDCRAEVELSEESPAEHRRRLIEEFAEQHPVSSILEAEVEQITKDGSIFVRLIGDLDGLVPISELSWGRTDRAAHEIAPGQSLRLIVIRIDDRGVVLSRRALMPKPYDVYRSAHAIGEALVGTVREATDTHVYIDLDNGDVNGVIYVGELAHEHIERASDHVVQGQEIRAQIRGFNDDRKQIELSVKALLPKPYEQFKLKHGTGNVVEGEVSGMNESFAYVALDGGAKGAIHVSKLARYRVPRPAALVAIGDRVRVQVLGFTEERSQVQLSLVETIHAQHRTGSAPDSTSVGALPSPLVREGNARARPPSPPAEKPRPVGGAPTDAVPAPTTSNPTPRRPSTRARTSRKASRRSVSRSALAMCLALLAGIGAVAASLSSGSGPTAPPRLRFGASCESLRCSFAQQQPKGGRALWRFGDGERARGKKVVHVFSKPGTYNVRLVVIRDGERRATSRRVYVKRVVKSRKIGLRLDEGSTSAGRVLVVTATVRSKKEGCRSDVPTLEARTGGRWSRSSQNPPTRSANGRFSWVGVNPFVGGNGHLGVTPLRVSLGRDRSGAYGCSAATSRVVEYSGPLMHATEVRTSGPTVVDTESVPAAAPPDVSAPVNPPESGTSQERDPCENPTTAEEQAKCMTNP